MVGIRVAKCHGCDGYIRVKILTGWGKTHSFAKSSFFRKIWSVYVKFGRVVYSCSPKSIHVVSFVQFKCQNCRFSSSKIWFEGWHFATLVGIELIFNKMQWTPKIWGRPPLNERIFEMWLVWQSWKWVIFALKFLNKRYEMVHPLPPPVFDFFSFKKSSFL